MRPGRAAKLDIPTGVTDEDGKAVFIKAADVPRYFSEEFWMAYEFYAAVELLKFPPFPGGWTSWPAIAVDILLLFKAEANRCDREEIEGKAEQKPHGGHHNRKAKAGN